MLRIEEMNFAPFSFKGENEPPQLLSLAYSSADKQILHGVWESEPGELELNFQWTETVFILEGKAHVKNLDTLESFTLLPGTLATFEKESRWKWIISQKLKKVFTIIDGVG